MLPLQLPLTLPDVAMTGQFDGQPAPGPEVGFALDSSALTVCQIQRRGATFGEGQDQICSRAACWGSRSVVPSSVHVDAVLGSWALMR